MKRGGALLARLVVLAAIAGCVAPAAPVGPDPLEIALPLDHDHAALAGHDLAQGLARVGGARIEELLGDGPGRISDLQFHEGFAAVAVNGGAGGFVLLNASDLSVVSRYRSGSEDNWYVKFTPDGRYVLLTANGNFAPNAVAEGGLEALTRGTFTHAARGLQVVDIADPARPTLAGVYPSAIRLINAAPWEADGSTFVAVSVVTDRAVSGAPTATGALPNGIDILRLDAGRPTRIASWQPPSDAGPSVFVHDLAYEVHPITGAPLLYAACWDAGAYLLDVSDPSAPVEVGSFRPDEERPQVHTVKPHPGLLDGRHYTLTSPETFTSEPSGRYHLLDTTDPSAPRLVATWELPGELTNAENLLWSPHEFSLGEGRAYTSDFHAGVVVLSIPELAPIAAWASPDALPREESARWAIDVETAVWHDGRLYAVDMGRGIDILALG